MAKRGRKSIPETEYDARRAAWLAAKKHSGMSTRDIGKMLGKHEGTVRGYGGAFPAGWDDIEKLRRTALDAAVKNLGGAVFYGRDVDPDAVLFEGEKIRLSRAWADAYGRQPQAL